MRSRFFMCKGPFYIGVYPDGPLFPVSTVTEASLSHEEDEKSVPNVDEPGGGEAASLSHVTSVKLTAKLFKLDASNIAMLLRGTASEVPSGMATDEPVTLHHGALCRLEGVSPSGVVLTDSSGSTTYAEGTDYTVSRGGIMPLASGSIPDGSDGLVDYSYAAFDRVEALTAAAVEYAVFFEGFNEGDGDTPHLVDVYRIKPGVAGSFELVGNDYTGYDLTAKVLADPLQEGSGLSRFYRVTQAA